MVTQAKSQVDAKENRPLIWFFDEEAVADEMREVFKEDKLDIEVEWLPMPRSSK